jgi:hypothetical protein
MPDISVYDSLSVSDRAASGILGDFEIFIVEFALPVDYSYTPDLTRTISEYESVSAAEDIEFADTIGPTFSMEDRASGYPRMPIWEIDSAFAPAFNLRSDLLMPQRSGQGAFSGSLDGKISAYSLAASFITPDVYMSLSGRLPSYSLEAAVGGVLSGRLPTYSLDAGFTSEGYFTLSRRRPVWELTATFVAPSNFTLNADMPVWAISAEMSIAWLSGSLSSDIPGAFIIDASMRQVGTFSLDEDIPAWRLTSTLYSSSMALEANMPAWLIEDAMDAVIQYSNRFSDYILRYARP